MTLLSLFRRALAAVPWPRPRIAAPAVPGTRGRSLLNDPIFLALAREYEARFDPPRRATVRDVTQGHWYALKLAPGAELPAIHRVANATWLPTYVPRVRELRWTRRGAVAFRRALFTGYGFVLAADIDDMFANIRSCDGVIGIMCENGEPAIIRIGSDGCRKGCTPPPMRFDHDLIEFIRMVENGENSWLLEQFDRQVVNIAPGRKRRRRRSKRARGKRGKASPPATLPEAACAT